MASRDDSYGLVGGGYFKPSAAVGRIFNLALAALLLLFALPVIAVVALAVLLRIGRPVVYKGARLGLHKREFVMYKFRTLVPNAEDVVGPNLLTHDYQLATPFGRFLRETRLDELLQLINVLKGDMDLVGPRPVRPAVYEAICKHIPNYDVRFGVMPGVVGFAQLFTPHTSPKRIRTLVDNALVRKKDRLAWDVGIVFYAGWRILSITVTRTCKFVANDLLRSKVVRRYEEKRKLERVAPREEARVLMKVGAQPVATLIDINERAFLMRASAKLEVDAPVEFTLETEVRRGGDLRARRKRATCRGRVYRETVREDDLVDYVVEYKPVSPLNYYMINQYFLSRSMA